MHLGIKIYVGYSRTFCTSRFCLSAQGD